VIKLVSTKTCGSRVRRFYSQCQPLSPPSGVRLWPPLPGAVAVRRAGNIPPSIPTRAAKPPAGPDWVHEIKHDGYRLIVRRDDAAVRLFMRRGYDWSERYPAIARAAWKLRAKSFTLNREAAVCGPDGIAIFDALHRRGAVTEAMLYAFDLLELDGVDYRPLPLGKRKERALGRPPTDRHRHERSRARPRQIGVPTGFRTGLEGIVSKPLTAPYRSGPSRDLAQNQEPGQPRHGATSGGDLSALPVP
jgi:bifunctional non-homologous end joining protein LigD